MIPPPRKLFDPPLSLGEFLDHAQIIAIDPTEPAEVRAAAMRALSQHLADPPPTPSPPRVAGPSVDKHALALALGVLVGLAVSVLVVLA